MGFCVTLFFVFLCLCLFVCFCKCFCPLLMYSSFSSLCVLKIIGCEFDHAMLYVCILHFVQFEFLIWSLFVCLTVYFFNQYSLNASNILFCVCLFWFICCTEVRIRRFRCACAWFCASRPFQLGVFSLFWIDVFAYSLSLFLTLSMHIFQSVLLFRNMFV